MSKAVLIMDMPESCRDCMIRSLADDCQTTGRYVQGYRHNNSKPDWCPMKELPEMCHITGASGQTKDYVNGYRTGWNDCIDIITGGNDNE